MIHYADMLTAAPPRKAGLAAFKESDRIRTLHLPENGSLVTQTKSIDAAMKGGRGADIRRFCDEFLNTASDFYVVPRCAIRVLAARQFAHLRKLDPRTLRRLRH
jgi:hypothetical protein